MRFVAKVAIVGIAGLAASCAADPQGRTPRGPHSTPASATSPSALPGTGSAPLNTTDEWVEATQIGNEGTSPNPSVPPEDGPGVDWDARCPSPSLSPLALDHVEVPGGAHHDAPLSTALRPRALHVARPGVGHYRLRGTAAPEQLPGPVDALPDVVTADGLGLAGLAVHAGPVAIERVLWRAGVGWSSVEQVEVDEVLAVQAVGEQLVAVVRDAGGAQLHTWTGGGRQVDPLPADIDGDVHLGGTDEGGVLVAWVDGGVWVLPPGADTAELALPVDPGPRTRVHLTGRGDHLALLVHREGSLWVADRRDGSWAHEQLVEARGALNLGQGTAGAWLTVDDRFGGGLGLHVGDDGVLRLLTTELTRQGTFTVVPDQGFYAWDSPGLQGSVLRSHWSAEGGLHQVEVVATGIPALDGVAVEHRPSSFVVLHELEHCEAVMATGGRLLRLAPGVWPGE